jgi:hypothetical protein
MSVYLTIPHVAINKLIGWGHRPKPRDYHYRLEFADVGELAVYYSPLLRDTKVLSMSIEELELTTTVEQLRVRRDIGGGGSGASGAVILSAIGVYYLTGRHDKTYEYPLLIAKTITANGARRHAAFAFGALDEAALRDQLAQPLHDWAEAYVRARVAELTDRPVAIGQLDAIYSTVDRMQARDILTGRQALALRSHASAPFVTEMIRQLRTNTTAGNDAARIRAQVEDMRKRGRLTADQTAQITHLITSQRPAVPASPRSHRLELVQTLADLRSSGALTESEFQAEKARLLQADEPQ